jgi:hypothetical protein
MTTMKAKVQKPIWKTDERGHTYSDSYEWVEVQVGDYVGFKADVEQHGRIIEITRGGWDGKDACLLLENPNGFPGDYLRYATRTKQMASDCWVE